MESNLKLKHRVISSVACLGCAVGLGFLTGHMMVNSISGEKVTSIAEKYGFEMTKSGELSFDGVNPIEQGSDEYKAVMNEYHTALHEIGEARGNDVLPEALLGLATIVLLPLGLVEAKISAETIAADLRCHKHVDWNSKEI